MKSSRTKGRHTARISYAIFKENSSWHSANWYREQTFSCAMNFTWKWILQRQFNEAGVWGELYIWKSTAQTWNADYMNIMVFNYMSM